MAAAYFFQKKGKEMIENIWEGIYKNFSEVPIKGKGHEGDVWISRSRERIRHLLKLSREKRPVSKTVINRDNLLPFLTSLLLSEKGKLKILDFGGGMGFTYIPVTSAQTAIGGIEYHILELESVITESEKIFRADPNIFFYPFPSFPQPKIIFDIIHIGSSMQYVENWKNLLKKLSQYKAKFFLFSDLYAGDIPTYVTAQNYYGSKMPCWFFNFNDVVNQMKKLGYHLQFRSTYIAKILGAEQESPQQNFPKKYRLGHACNLLFVKKQ